MIDEMILIDLHSHTSASDGMLSPTELIDRAIEKEIAVLAITDHDTTAGLCEAQQYNQHLTKPLILIDGVEISTRWHSYDIHIVALQIDANNPVLMDFLDNQRQLRDVRAKEIGVRLAKAGIEGAFEGASELANGAALSRGHFARFLADSGYATSMANVFKRYLSRGKTGYVPNNWLDMATAIEVIHQAGGIAVLAHPTGYKLSTKWLKRLVAEFKQAKGDALEVVLSQQSIDDRNKLIALSYQHELYASLGSDFHFPGRFSELGRGMWQPKDVNWVWQMPNWVATVEPNDNIGKQ